MPRNFGDLSRVILLLVVGEGVGGAEEV